MLRQKLVINMWLLHLVGFLSLHTLLTMHGHRNLRSSVIFLEWLRKTTIWTSQLSACRPKLNWEIPENKCRKFRLYNLLCSYHVVRNFYKTEIDKPSTVNRPAVHRTQYLLLKHWESFSLYTVAQKSPDTTSDMLNSDCDGTFATLCTLEAKYMYSDTSANEWPC